MRIRITGEKLVIDDLGAELARHGEGVEFVERSIDRTEQTLGLLEAAAIIGIVTNVATLIKYLIEVGRHLRDGEKRRLEVKTAVATTFISIDNKSTPENLAKQLSPHGTTSGPVSGAAPAATSVTGSDAEKKA
ncbi:MAG: hypothetical protein ABI363_01775 [Nitrosospira sp.]